MKFKFKFKNKITTFDIVFGTVFLVLMLGIFLFFYRKNEYVNIRVKVTDQDVLYAITNPKSWYANRFEVGDTETDELGRVVSQITGVETFNMTADTKAVYLDVKIKAVYNRRTKLYSAKGTDLIFGNTIRLYFSKVAASALITESPSTLNQKNFSVEKREIVLLERGPGSIEKGPGTIEPEVLESIKKGDVISDSTGKVLAEVTDVVLRPAQRVTTTSRGELLLTRDPYYKDAIITLNVMVKNYKGDRLIFDTIPMKLGVTLPLNFSYSTIFPTIISIK